MKRVRRSAASLRFPVRLWVALLALTTGSLVLSAPPAWWHERGVLRVNAHGVVEEADITPRPIKDSSRTWRQKLSRNFSINSPTSLAA